MMKNAEIERELQKSKEHIRTWFQANEEIVLSQQNNTKALAIAENIGK